MLWKQRAAFVAFWFVTLTLPVFGQFEFSTPLEDVRRIIKPTICYAGGDSVWLVDWDGQNNRLWIPRRGDSVWFGEPPKWSPDGKRAAAEVVQITHGDPGGLGQEWVLSGGSGKFPLGFIPWGRSKRRAANETPLNRTERFASPSSTGKVCPQLLTCVPSPHIIMGSDHVARRPRGNRRE